MNRLRTRTMWLSGAVLTLSLILSACATPPTTVPATAAPAATTAAEATVAPTEAPVATEAATEAPTTEATVEATAEVTDTAMMTGTAAMTDTAMMTDTEMMTGTTAMTDTAMMTDTEMMTGTAAMTDTAMMTGTEMMTGTSAMTATEPMTSAAVGSGMVAVGDSTFGKILVDDKGMSLYMYTKDITENVSVCYDQCAVAWPPLLTADAPKAGDGVDASLLGTTTRKDGTTQVTYKGMPLYYWFKDFAVGDVFGQDVGTVWYVMAPSGEVIKTAGEKIAIGDTKLGKILVDEDGMTLYVFTKDAKNESVCYDQCETNWPPVITEGAPHPSGAGVDGKLLGMIKRKDGKLQATYNGMPLYYYAKDKAVGDTTGQDVGEVWYVVSGDGKIVE